MSLFFTFRLVYPLKRIDVRLNNTRIFWYSQRLLYLGRFITFHSVFHDRQQSKVVFHQRPRLPAVFSNLPTPTDRIEQYDARIGQIKFVKFFLQNAYGIHECRENSRGV